MIATGVEWRRLRAPGVAELIGLGVDYGAHPRDADDLVDREVVIVGGANSAGQAAVAFAKSARKVTMVIRAGSLAKDMSRYLIKDIEARPNIEVMTHTELSQARGHARLESISVRRRGEPVAEPLRADDLFIFIGAQPYTQWLKGTLARDSRGFILAGPDLGAGSWDAGLAAAPASLRARDLHARRLRRRRYPARVDQTRGLRSWRGLDGRAPDSPVPRGAGIIRLVESNRPTRQPGEWVIACFCGHQVRGETDVELLSNARNHIDEAHPERTDQTDEQLLARAEKQSALSPLKRPQIQVRANVDNNSGMPHHEAPTCRQLRFIAGSSGSCYPRSVQPLTVAIMPHNGALLLSRAQASPVAHASSLAA